MTSRYFGIDAHKAFLMIAAVNAQQEILQPAKRVAMSDAAAWAAQTLTREDLVVLEVTSNAWLLYDLFAQYAEQVIVVNPYKTKLIAEARIKSDKIDALALAQLLASGFVSRVWVPDQQVRGHRELATHRTRLAQQTNRLKNRIHAVLNRRQQHSPVKSIFSQAGRAWLARLELTPWERLELDQLCDQLQLAEPHLEATERQIARLAAQDARVPRLMQMTGIGYVTAFCLLAAVGTIDRFPTPDHLTAYAGLVPSLNQSGQHAYHGHITKAGTSSLRWLMVEAAWSAIRFDPHWRQQFTRLERKCGTSVAIVAIARKLLVVVWHLLSKVTHYYYLQPKVFIRKLQDWAWRIGSSALPASTSADFVRQCLRRLDLESLADHWTTDKKGRLRILVTPA